MQKEFNVTKIVPATLVKEFRVYAETSEEARQLIESEEHNWTVEAYYTPIGVDNMSTMPSILPVSVDVEEYTDGAIYDDDEEE